MSSNRIMTYVLTALLAFSLVFNGIALNRLSGLERRVNQLQSSLSSQMSGLQSEVSSMGGQLSAIQEAERWHSRPVFEVADINGACTLVLGRLSWSFRELSEGARVGLSYRLSEGEWQEAEVRPVNGTTYQATVEIPIEARMAGFSIGLQPADDRPAPATAEEVGGPGTTLEYVIHATEAGTQRSGESERVQVGKLAGFFVARLIEVEPNRSYNATLYQEAGADCFAPAAVEFWAEAAGEGPGDGPGAELDSTKLVAEQRGGRELWTGTLELEGEARVEELGVRVTLANGQEIIRQIAVR